MARKRKGPYVPPVGQPLPIRSEAGEAQWEWLEECLRRLQTWIPLEHEPETLGWHDPLEAIHKERAEKLQVEREHEPAARAAFEELLGRMEWPEASPEAAFVMRARLEWAASVVAVLRGLQGPSGSMLPLPRSLRGKDLIRWLCFELYDSPPCWPRQWWNTSSFEEHYRF